MNINSVPHVTPCLSCRALRLGYNVLLADADVIFFDDPYRFFKQPPFKVRHDCFMFACPEQISPVGPSALWLTTGSQCSHVLLFSV